MEIIKPEADKVVINNMQLTIRSVDRTFKDIAHWWNALQQAESVYYPNRSELYDIYETVMLDGHLTGVIENQRIKNVINKTIYFKKGDKKVDELNALIETDKFKELRRQRMMKYFYGLQGWEFIPGPEFDFKNIPIKHINLQKKMITTEQWGTEGISYEGVWNIIVIGKENDFGLLLKCCPYVIWKKGNMGDWAQYIQDFGSPMIIFTYDAHDIKTKVELDEIMKSIGNSTRLQLPKQAGLEIKDGKTSNGDGKLQDTMRNACNAELSVLILGATETVVSSKSSGYAQSETHSKTINEVLQDDMDDELRFLNSPQFLDILKSYGYPVTGGRFCHEQDMDTERLKADMEIDKSLDQLGVPLSDDYFYEKYNRPKPDNYDELKQKKEEEKKNRNSFFENNNNSGNGNNNNNNNPPNQFSKIKQKSWLKNLLAFFVEAR
jgi:hypothetical protein